MAFKVTSSGIHVGVSETVIVALRFKLTCDVSLCASFLFLYMVKVIYRASFLILSVSLKHIPAGLLCSYVHRSRGPAVLWLRSITMRMPKLTSLIEHLPRLIDRVSNHDHLFIRLSVKRSIQDRWIGILIHLIQLDRVRCNLGTRHAAISSER